MYVNSIHYKYIYNHAKLAITVYNMCILETVSSYSAKRKWYMVDIIAKYILGTLIT